MPTPSTQASSQIEFAHITSIQLDTQLPISNKSPFLFVVKTPNSGILSRSTSRSTAASINSHAQRWVQEVAPSQRGSRKNDSNSTKPGQPLPFKQCVRRCHVDRLLADAKPARRRSNGPGEPATNRRKTPSPPGKPSTIIGNNHSTTPAAPDNEPSSELDRLPVTALHSFSAFSSIDPFNCTSLPIDDGVQVILQYYLSFVLLSTPQDQGLTPPDSGLVRHCSTIGAIVRGCLRESVHLYALLAATASRMRRVSGISFHPDSGPEFYLHQAIQSLRVLLDNQSAASDRQIILDIYYLSVCEWYLESYEASKTHLNYLTQVWNSLVPGLSTFDQYLYDMLSYNANFLSLNPSDIREATRQDPPSLDNGSFYQSPAWKPKRPPWASGHCSGFSSAFEFTTYSPDLKDIVHDLPPLLRLHHYLKRKLDFVGPEIEWVHSKSRSLINRLLELPSYGHELCCRLSLVLILRHISQFTSPQTTPTLPKMESRLGTDPTLVTRRLRRQLQYEILLPSNEISLRLAMSADSPNDTSFVGPAANIWTGQNNGLLLWILVTGLFAARKLKIMDEYHWFWARAMALMRLLAIATTGQLRDTMRSFVYVDEMLRDPMFDGVLIRSADDED